MRVSDLLDALRGSSPDADVVVCLEVPDGLGDHLLFAETPASFAEPYPGDEGRFLVHSTAGLSDIASQAFDPSVMRELARAIEREAERMESNEYADDKEEEIW